MMDETRSAIAEDLKADINQAIDDIFKGTFPGASGHLKEIRWLRRLKEEFGRIVDRHLSIKK